jgi:hypothetical protein
MSSRRTVGASSDRAERLRAASDIDVDAGRLEQEIAVFAERCDIAEELTRLESHCGQFAALLSAEKPSGAASIFSSRRWPARPTPSAPRARTRPSRTPSSS